MTKKEAGHLGGIATSIKFGIERCEHCHQLLPPNEHHKRIGAKGGVKGAAVLQRKYSAEQRREWARLGGRPKKEGNEKGKRPQNLSTEIPGHGG